MCVANRFVAVLLRTDHRRRIGLRYNMSENVDLDLNDPELERAATKIQVLPLRMYKPVGNLR